MLLHGVSRIRGLLCMRERKRWPNADVYRRSAHNALTGTRQRDAKRLFLRNLDHLNNNYSL